MLYFKRYNFFFFAYVAHLFNADVSFSFPYVRKYTECPCKPPWLAVRQSEKIINHKLTKAMHKMPYLLKILALHLNHCRTDSTEISQKSISEVPLSSITLRGSLFKIHP